MSWGQTCAHVGVLFCCLRTLSWIIVAVWVGVDGGQTDDGGRGCAGAHKFALVMPALPVSLAPSLRANAVHQTGASDPALVFRCSASCSCTVF